MAINPATNRLRDAPQFASPLSSIVYCVRILATEASLPSALRADQDAAATKALLQQRARYLVDGSHSPMSVMISLLAYVKHISLHTLSSIAGATRWSPDQQTFFLKSHAISLPRFQAMAQEVVASAERLLWEELLWTTVEQGKQQHAVDLAAIHDDTTVRRRGASFLPPSLLEEGSDWILCQLASSPAAQYLYGSQQSQSKEGKEGQQDRQGRSEGAALQWRPKKVRRYLQRAAHFLELLCLAVHLTGGQPARGPELLSLRWRNSAY